MRTVELIEEIKKQLAVMTREEKVRFLKFLADIISVEGQELAPRNFVWKALRYSLDNPVLYCEEKDPALLSPVFVASILKHGQLLPAFVSPDGTVIDGRARYAILGDQLEYIIMPETFSRKKLEDVHTVSAESDPLLRIAEKEGAKAFTEELGIDTGNISASFHEEMRATARSLVKDLSLPEKTKVYVLLREMTFWRMIIVEAKRKIAQIKEGLNLT